MKDNSIKKYTCPVCQSRMRFAGTGEDFLYKTTKYVFNIYRCINCQLESIKPIPSSSEIANFYPKKYYSYNLKDPTVRKGFFTILREKIIDISYNKHIKKDGMYYLAKLFSSRLEGLPTHHINKRRFLDVGCGDGYNLELMQKYGWKCTGFEIGNKDKIDKIIFHDDLTKVNFADKKFDAIRIWHVLEHTPNPEKFIGYLSEIIDKKGEIYIGVPNTSSLYAKLFGKYWYNRDIPRHINNFNPKSLELLLGKNGLKIDKLSYNSAGGFVGSVQHFINTLFGTKVNLIDNFFVVVFFYPLDIICNLLHIGDCISVVAKK